MLLIISCTKLFIQSSLSGKQLRKKNAIKNLKKNWLGGGETYVVSESDPTENGKRFFDVLQGRSTQEIMQTLMEMEQNNWIQLYSPV